MAKYLAELTESSETADTLFSKAERAIKYRKDSEGKPITAGYVGALTEEINESLGNMLMDMKTVRIHAPKQDVNDT